LDSWGNSRITQSKVQYFTGRASGVTIDIVKLRNMWSFMECNAVNTITISAGDWRTVHMDIADEYKHHHCE